MRPLARLHAVTDAATLAHPDFDARARAIAEAGAAVALHARDRAASGAVMAAVASRLLALARPSEAAVFVSARADIAAALGAAGVQLGADDLAPADAREILRHANRQCWIGRSVHGLAEAREAIAEGADFLLVGPVYRTTSHPERPATGLELVRETAVLGSPVVAIGGITPERAGEVRDAGAYGVAAISAVWYADDPAAATLGLLEPWMDEA